MAALMHIESVSDDTPVVIAQHGGARITHHVDCADIANADSVRHSTWANREGFIDSCFDVSISVFTLGGPVRSPEKFSGNGQGAPRPAAELASEKQIGFIRSLLASKNVPLAEALAFVDTTGQVSDLPRLTKSQASSLITHLQGRPAPVAAAAPVAVPVAVDVPAAKRFLASLGRKVELADVTPELIAAATSWAASYDGSFGFMCDMRHDAQRGTLSAAKAKGVLNCLRHTTDAPSGQGSAPAPKVEGLDLSGLPAGHYAVPNGETRLKVLVERPDKGSWAGWIFVSDGAVYGSGTKYGRQAPGGKYSGKIVEELKAILADPREAMAAYGRLTGRCGMCHRHLEDEGSIAAGIGPVCATRF